MPIEQYAGLDVIFNAMVTGAEAGDLEKKETLKKMGRIFCEREIPRAGYICFRHCF
jgi:hypothetical protein